MVTAEHDGDRAGPYGPAYHLAQIRVALLDVAWRHEHVARIDNVQLLKRIEAETQVRSSRDVRLRVAEPDRVGAKARARAVRGSAVERRPDDHRIGRGELGRVALVSALDTEERDVRAKHRSHGREIGCALAAWGDIL